MDTPQVAAAAQLQLLLHRGTIEDTSEHCMAMAGNERDHYQSSGLLPNHKAINEVLQFAI